MTFGAVAVMALAASFAPADDVVVPGDRVKVRLRDSRTLMGAVQHVSATSIVIDGASIDPIQIDRVSRSLGLRTSTKRGALIGVTVALAFGAIAGGSCGGALTAPPCGNSLDEGEMRWIAGGIVALGAGIGRAVKHEEWVRASLPSSSVVSARVEPWPKGIRVAISW